MAALSAAGHHVIRTAGENVLDALELARASAESGDFSAARAELERAGAEFEEHGHVLELFLKREYVANLHVSLAGLPAYAQPGNACDLFSEIRKTEQQVRMIQHMYGSIL